MDFTGERLIPDQQRDDDLYDEHIVRYLFAADLAKGKVILDAGCGTGYGSALLADGGAHNVLGIDIAPEAITYAQEHYRRGNLSFLVSDICNLNLHDASLDMVVAFEVIEHLDEPTCLVQTAARLLKPEGIFIVSTPNLATYPAGNPFHKHEMALTEFTSVLGESFPAQAVFGEDYATALSLRRYDHMQTPSSGAWTFVPAARRIPYEPDYFVAVCARQQETLDRTLEQTHNIMYELAADRLGERIRDQMTVQAVLDETFRRIADKDAYIAHLEHELERQGAWATDLEKQILALRSTWYVRLFSRRLRRETPRDDAHH